MIAPNTLRMEKSAAPGLVPVGAPSPGRALLTVNDLHVHFVQAGGVTRAVEGVSFSVRQGQILALVGESGCGKSATALALMRLLARPAGRVVKGEVLFDGVDLLKLSEAEMRERRGRDISMIFQEPMTSLNPVLTVGRQIGETVMLHEGLSAKDAEQRAVEMLTLVGIPAPGRRVREYPHQLSGGMRQRVMIAMALSCQPKLLIADEPTTALDVTIQAQILELMQEMKERFGMAIMLITHAMGVVAETTQRVVVMYAGKVVEEAPVGALFGDPRHPYTQGLIRSIPRVDRSAGRQARLESIPGTVPSLLNPPPGCRFAARCRYVMPACTEAIPPLKEVAPGHKVACIL